MSRLGAAVPREPAEAAEPTAPPAAARRQAGPAGRAAARRTGELRLPPGSPGAARSAAASRTAAAVPPPAGSASPAPRCPDPSREGEAESGKCWRAPGRSRVKGLQQVRGAERDGVGHPPGGVLEGGDSTVRTRGRAGWKQLVYLSCAASAICVPEGDLWDCAFHLNGKVVWVGAD